jgi:hypothetical protein
MATLAFNHVEIGPRPLKPALLEMDGISRASVEAHYKLYQGYVTRSTSSTSAGAEASPTAPSELSSSATSAPLRAGAPT